MYITRLVSIALYRFGAVHLPTSERSKLARRVRVAAARPLLASCGSGVNVERGAMFPPGMVTLGDRSGIGIRAQIKGPVDIGPDVMMGPEVVIFTTGHNFGDLDRPMMDQGATRHRPVIIEDDVWIGQRAMILPGVTVGTGSIVAAGAVVTRDVPPRSVVAGNPAKVVRER